MQLPPHSYLATPAIPLARVTTSRAVQEIKAYSLVQIPSWHM